jgi:hypothetical protein
MPPLDDNEYGFDDDLNDELLHLTQAAEEGLINTQDGLENDQLAEDDEESCGSDTQNPGDKESPSNSESNNRISRNNNSPDSSEASNQELGQSRPDPPNEGSEDVSPSQNK